MLKRLVFGFSISQNTDGMMKLVGMMANAPTKPMISACVAHKNVN